jgi:glycosyltransferase involved in cell wall biosynthesis
MCDEWAKRDSRVKVIHKGNGGLSSARNTGLDVSTGKYISFIDSDDSILPYMYSDLISQLEDNQLDMISCLIQVVNGDKTLGENIALNIQDELFMLPKGSLDKIKTLSVVTSDRNEVWFLLPDNNEKYSTLFLVICLDFYLEILMNEILLSPVFSIQ